MHGSRTGKIICLQERRAGCGGGGGGSNGLGGDSAGFKRTKHAGAIVTGERVREKERGVVW